jgi:hypothetical protein
MAPKDDTDVPTILVELANRAGTKKTRTAAKEVLKVRWPGLASPEPSEEAL